MTRQFHICAAILAALWAGGCAGPPRSESADLRQRLSHLASAFPEVFENPGKFRLQILLSEVVRRGNRSPALVRHSYRADAEYFYPASTIKLGAAALALQQIDRLELDHGVSQLLHAPMEIDPLFPGDLRQVDDSSNLNGGRITVGHEIRKLCLVSDNQAFNRLYDFLGHEQLNRGLWKLGLSSAVINHRLSEPRTITNPRDSAAVTLRPRQQQPVQIPACSSSLILSNQASGLFVGSGFVQGNSIKPAPMDFTLRNGISLRHLQDLLIKICRPDISLGATPLRLSPAHRDFLLQGMTEYPNNSRNPVYSETSYPDHYSKFLLPGIRRVFPSAQPGERIEVTGKIGRAYGFTVENSYLHNPANDRGVFVTAVLYTNEDGILNDDRYEYDTLADPFYAALGEWVAREWLEQAPAGAPP